jgi:hypothetical protein
METKLDIINRVLAKYGVEPLTEDEITRAKSQLPPSDPQTLRESFEKLWQTITEMEAGQAIS